MLRYYIQPKRKMRPSKKTEHFETQPGYQLQHDRREVDVAGQRCKVNFAVNTLGFSGISSGWKTVPEHHAAQWHQVSQVEHRPLSVYEELL